jgi:hypothetical protein
MVGVDRQVWMRDEGFLGFVPIARVFYGKWPLRRVSIVRMMVPKKYDTFGLLSK